MTDAHHFTDDVERAIARELGTAEAIVHVEPVSREDVRDEAVRNEDGGKPRMPSRFAPALRGYAPCLFGKHSHKHLV